MAREWGLVTAASVTAALTDGHWRGHAAIAEAIGTGKVQLVAYRCRVMLQQGLLERDQVPYNTGGTPMNVYRLKLSAVKSAAS